MTFYCKQIKAIVVILMKFIVNVVMFNNWRVRFVPDFDFENLEGMKTELGNQPLKSSDVRHLSPRN